VHRVYVHALETVLAKGRFAAISTPVTLTRLDNTDGEVDYVRVDAVPQYDLLE
jgi:hypothetical protein